MNKDGPPIFMVNHDTPEIHDMPATCRGEPMQHQSRVIRVLSELENAPEIKIADSTGQQHIIRTNRYKIDLPMGTGKTKTSIGLIIKSPHPPIKPIYWIDGYHPGCAANECFIQERIFPASAIIKPTIIVVRSSVYAQWIAEIEEFSTLRVYQACDSRSTVKLADLVANGLAAFNANYDIVLIDYKTISGNVDSILAKCAATYSCNTSKTKNIYTLLMNAFTRKCMLRIIYDDPEFSIKVAPFENAVSCIYLSATHNYGAYTSKSIAPAAPNPGPTPAVGDGRTPVLAATLEDLELEFASYTLSNGNLNNVVTIGANKDFLMESIRLGLGHMEIGGVISAGSSMMPPEPEVYICHIDNKESKVIDIIDLLCNDAKIMESVNSLAKRSFGAVIKDLMANRFEVYSNAMRIIAHYEAFDMRSLLVLPKPPEGASFTVDNLMRCDPILYAWRDLPNRIAAVVEDARKVVKAESTLLDRVKSHLSGGCVICLEELNTTVCAIMICCNNILHMSCALKCIARACPFCRAPYGKTSADTFAILHHDTDYAAFTSADSAADMLEAIKPDPAPPEITKMSVLNDIMRYNFDNIPKRRVKLNKLRSLAYDEKVNVPTEANNKQMKALIYCSADDTLEMVERNICVDHARLTGSSARTYKKIMHFRNSPEPTAILANSWRDAAGIDFKTATDVVIINYMPLENATQQMMARVLRMGRTTRPRIWLLSYTNETQRWLSSYVAPIAAT